MQRAGKKMALILQHAIVVKDYLEDKYGVHLSMTDNCAGQFFSIEKPLTQEMKDYIDSYVKELKQRVIYWDDHSLSVW